jgi:hypothetical protein
VETTNGQVVFSDGTPAKSAVVKLIDNTNWLSKISQDSSVILAQFTTDNNGRFEITSLPGKDYNIVISSLSEGLVEYNVNKANPQDLIKDPFILKTLKKYVVSARDVSVSKIFFAGTDIEALPDETNQLFTLLAPSEEYELIGKLADQKPSFTMIKSVNMITYLSGTIDSSITETAKYVRLFDNFEDQDNRTRLGLLFGNGWWKLYDDQNVGGTSRLVTPSNASPSEFVQALNSDNGYMGNYLQIQYSGGTAGSLEPYSYITLESDIGVTHYNIERLDSLEFYAKGNGSVIIELVQYIPEISMTVLAVSEKLPLTSDWKVYHISRTDFIITARNFPANITSYHSVLKANHIPLYQSAPEKWYDTKGSFKTIRFKFTGGTSVSIDEIKLLGLTLEDFITYD